MSLEKKVYDAVSKTRQHFSASRKSIRTHLIGHDLKKYFEGVSDDERKLREKVLDSKLEQVADKYEGELEGLGRKIGSKGSMALAVINDVAAYVSKVPIPYVTGAGYALFGIKTLLEAPAMYRYVKKSGDWYGATKHMLLKPLRYLIPVVGPALESGAFDRMVKKKVGREVKSAFIKEVGDYITFDDRMKLKLTQPVSAAVYRKAA